MQHSRLPLVAGVVDTLMGQRQILGGNLGNPCVYEASSVWRLDRVTGFQQIYTVSRKQWKILGKTHSAGHRQTCDRCK